MNYYIVFTTLFIFFTLESVLRSGKIKIAFLLLSITLYSVFSSNRDIISDTKNYFDAYTIFNGISENGWEYFYQFLEFLGKYFGLNFKQFLFVCAIFPLLLSFAPYMKKKPSSILLIFALWLLAFSPILTWTVMRQNLALGTLASLPFFLAQEKYTKAFFIVLLAAGFHIGALALLPLCIKLNFKCTRASDRFVLSMTWIPVCFVLSFLISNINFISLIGIRSFSFYIDNASLIQMFSFSYLNFITLPLALVLFHYYDLTNKIWAENEGALYMPLLYGVSIEIFLSFYGPFLPLRYAYFFIPFIIKLIFDWSKLVPRVNLILLLISACLVPHYVSLLTQHFSVLS